jgi:hypothetical protein
MTRKEFQSTIEYLLYNGNKFGYLFCLIDMYSQEYEIL